MVPHRLPMGPVPAWSSPPYRELRPLPVPGNSARETLPRAAVLVLDAAPTAEDCAVLENAVRGLRGRFPAAPVVVRVPELSAAAIRLAQRAAHLGVRAVVGMDEPLGDALRPILTHPDDLGDDVVEWLAVRGRTLAPVSAALVRQVVGQAHRFAHLGDLLSALGDSERTARHRLRGRGLPPPSAWYQMARALHGALRIQAQPEAALAPLALELGYADRSGLSWQLTRAFGVTPVAVRGTLGWEWLLDRWLHRPGAARSAAVTPAATTRF
jgi:AraC-like DNA-binding protein